MRRLILLLAACLVVAGTVVVVPGSSAQSGAWETPMPLPLTDAITRLWASNNGEHVGVAYTYQTTAKVGFSLWDGTTWTEKTADFDGAGTVTGLQAFSGTHTAGTTWYIAAGDNKVWRSTDDGVTWAIVASGTWSGGIGEIAAQGSTVGATGCAAPCSSGVGFRGSTDGGTTWTTSIDPSNNRGAPNGDASSTAQWDGGAGGLTITGGVFRDVFESSGFLLGEGLGPVGGFWSVPYGPVGSCPTTPPGPATDGNTNKLPTYKDSIAFSAPQAIDQMVLFKTGATQRTVSYYIDDRSNAGDHPYACTNGAGKTDISDNCGTGTPDNTGNTHLAVATHGFGQYLFAYVCTSGTLGFNAMFKTPTGGFSATYNVPGISGVNSAMGAAMTPNYSWLVYANTLNGGQVFATRASTPSALNQAPTKTAAVVGLAGFDVDPYNQVVIDRRNVVADHWVDAYDPTTLALKGASPVSNACNRINGVMAFHSTTGKNFLAYTNCDGGGSNTNKVSIRGGDLGDPDQSGTVCGDFCLTDLTTSSNSDTQCSSGHTLPSRLNNIGNVAAFPIDWSRGEESNFGNLFHGQVKIGFAFTDDLNGNVGAWATREINNAVDSDCLVSLPFSSPLSTLQFCSWRSQVDINHPSYIAAIGNNAPTEVWSIRDANAADQQYDIQMSPVQIFSAPFDQLQGISCANNDAIVMDYNGLVSRLHVVGPLVGTSVWSVAGCANCAGRGVAFSGDGNWTAYIQSATTIAVANANTGATVYTAAMPTGVFKEMRLDDTGQRLWVAMDTSINWWDVHTSTTLVSVPPGTRLGPGGNRTCLDDAGNLHPCSASTNPPTSTGVFGGIGGTPGFPGIDIAALAAASGMTTTAFGGLVVVMLVAAFAGGFALFSMQFKSARVMVVFVEAGVCLALGLSLYFALIPAWIIVFIFVVASAIIIFWGSKT